LPGGGIPPPDEGIVTLAGLYNRLDFYLRDEASRALLPLTTAPQRLLPTKS